MRLYEVRHFIIPATLWTLGFGCWAAYSLSDVTVRENGVLVEPFFLIPIGWLCFFAGTVWVAVAAVRIAREMAAKKRQ